MSLAVRHRYSFADYIALEEVASTKHEFYAGEIYAMAGGTPEHAELAMSIGALLIEALRGKSCRVFGSDLRLRVLATGLATYPDVTVVCGTLDMDPDNKHTVVNPIALVEVLSESTESYDRNEKFEHYRTIPSLRAYLLVSQKDPAVELWQLESGTWQPTKALPGETLDVKALDIKLPVDAVYRRTSLRSG